MRVNVDPGGRQRPSRRRWEMGNLAECEDRAEWRRWEINRGGDFVPAYIVPGAAGFTRPDFSRWPVRQGRFGVTFVSLPEALHDPAELPQAGQASSRRPDLPLPARRDRQGDPPGREPDEGRRADGHHPGGAGREDQTGPVGEPPASRAGPARRPGRPVSGAGPDSGVTSVMSRAGRLSSSFQFRRKRRPSPAPFFRRPICPTSGRGFGTAPRC